MAPQESFQTASFISGEKTPHPLQNKALRMLTKSDRSVSTARLMKISRSLSVHQLGAYHMVLQVFKTYHTSKPAYHHQRFFGVRQYQSVRSQLNIESCINFNLSTARSSFFYQASKLWNAIPVVIKESSSLNQFKTRCKPWI